MITTWLARTSRAKGHVLPPLDSARATLGLMARRPTMLSTAQHEAAHIVVARALGVRVTHATARENEDSWGFVSHTDVRKRRPLVEALIAAAGVVYEARADDADSIARASSDFLAMRTACRRAGVSMRIVLRLTGALLHERAAIHDRVARALCERDLTAQDLRALERCACEAKCACGDSEDT